jgi:hypothetical protein
MRNYVQNIKIKKLNNYGAKKPRKRLERGWISRDDRGFIVVFMNCQIGFIGHKGCDNPTKFWGPLLFFFFFFFFFFF